MPIRIESEYTRENMAIVRTDLAQEARDLWRESADETTKLEGVEAVSETANGYRMENTENIGFQR